MTIWLRFGQILVKVHVKMWLMHVVEEAEGKGSASKSGLGVETLGLVADTEGKMLRTLSVTKPNVSIPKPAQNFWQTLRLPSSKPIHIITNQEERERRGE